MANGLLAKLNPILTAAVTVMVTVAGWQILDWVGYLESKTLPTISDVAETIVAGYHEGYLVTDLKASMKRLCLGFMVGSIAGILMGLWTGRSRIGAILIAPSFNGWRALPAVALAPLLIRVLGIDEPARITIISIGVFFPVWLNSHIGAGLVSAKYLELGATLRLGRVKRFLHIIFPASIPLIVAGLRAGLGIAFVMMFISEYISSNSGIGYRISLGFTVSRNDLIVAGLVQLGAIAFLVDEIFVFVSTRALPWLGRA